MGTRTSNYRQGTGGVMWLDFMIMKNVILAGMIITIRYPAASFAAGLKRAGHNVAFTGIPVNHVTEEHPSFSGDAHTHKLSSTQEKSTVFSRTRFQTTKRIPFPKTIHRYNNSEHVNCCTRHPNIPNRVDLSSNVHSWRRNCSYNNNNNKIYNNNNSNINKNNIKNYNIINDINNKDNNNDNNNNNNNNKNRNNKDNINNSDNNNGNNNHRSSFVYKNSEHVNPRRVYFPRIVNRTFNTKRYFFNKTHNITIPNTIQRNNNSEYVNCCTRHPNIPNRVNLSSNVHSWRRNCSYNNNNNKIYNNNNSNIN